MGISKAKSFQVMGSLRWVDGCKLLAVAALHPFVVNEETSWLGVFPAIGRSELDREV